MNIEKKKSDRKKIVIVAVGILLILICVGVVFGKELWESLNGSVVTETNNMTGFYTPSSETHCDENGRCTLTLYSGVRYVYEDEIWKRIEEARSLKDAWEIAYLNKGNFTINLIDYNYTYIKGNLSAPPEFDEEELEFEMYVPMCNETACWDEIKYKYKFKPKDGETEFEIDTMKEFDVTPLALIYHFDPTEQWGTLDANHDDDGDVTSIVDSNNGIASDLNGKNAEYIDFRGWNDTVPIGHHFNGINFTVDVQNVDNCWGLAVQHNKTGSYVTECLWADVDATNPLICEFVVDETWWTQGVNKLGVRLLSSDCDEGSPDHGEIDYGYMTVDYANPTTIVLQDADTENLEDTKVNEASPKASSGGQGGMSAGEAFSSNKAQWAYIKFNLSKVPSGQTVDDAKLTVFVYFNAYDSGETVTAWVYEVSNQAWVEGTTVADCSDPADCEDGIIWDRKPTAGDLIDTNNSFDGDASNYWTTWNVTSWVLSEYAVPYTNISFLINATLDYGTNDAITFYSKEEATTQLRPMLNITYSAAAPDTTPPYFSNNATNTTTFTNGTAINFTIDVTDDNNLDNTAGWIFSTNNSGNWTNGSYTSFTGDATTVGAWNVTLLNDTNNTFIEFKWFANDTTDNWNVSSTRNVTTLAAVGDTCDYSSGEWIVDCSEFCTIDTDTNIGSNHISFTGTGEIYLNAIVSLSGDVHIADGCKVVIPDAKGFNIS